MFLSSCYDFGVQMINRNPAAVMASVILLACQPVSALENKTVIGPNNVALADGARELLLRNADEGVRLTLLGLKSVLSRADRLAGLSNVCAGYFMLDDVDEALEYCNRALELDDSHWRALCNRALVYIKLERYDEAEVDIQKGLAIAPHSSKLATARRLLLDATNPVAPSVIIDDSRSGSYDDEKSIRETGEQAP